MKIRNTEITVSQLIIIFVLLMIAVDATVFYIAQFLGIQIENYKLLEKLTMIIEHVLIGGLNG